MAACDQALGIKSTVLADARPEPLDPRDGGDTCTTPNLATWHFAPRAYPASAGVLHPTFTAANRVIYMYQERLFEGALDGTGVKELTELLNAGAPRFAGPAAAPGGDVFWYIRFADIGGGLYYAVRSADGWMSHDANFGLTVSGLEPGSAAFYRRAVRMVAAISPAGSGYALQELSSPDGSTWTVLDTIPWSMGDARHVDPALSPDGCVLLFSHYDSMLHVAFRQTDGSFAPPIAIDVGEPSDGTVTQPAISPDGARVWFNSSSRGLVEGTP